MPQIYDMGPTALLAPLKEGVLKIFFRPKNATASAGFEPANLGTKGQHATPRLPKPLVCYYVRWINIKSNKTETLMQVTVTISRLKRRESCEIVCNS